MVRTYACTRCGAHFHAELCRAPFWVASLLTLCAHAHAHTLTDAHTRSRTRTRAHTRTHAHTRTRTRARAHAHAHTHTRTRACTRSCVLAQTPHLHTHVLTHRRACTHNTEYERVYADKSTHALVCSHFCAHTRTKLETLGRCWPVYSPCTFLRMLRELPHVSP